MNLNNVKKKLYASYYRCFRFQVSTIDFKYRRFSERNYYVPAMHTLDNIVKKTNLNTGDGFSTVWGKVYGNWVTDEVIDTEVLRNLILALVCVMFCTIIIIINVQICFWIFICVVLTLVSFIFSLISETSEYRSIVYSNR